MSYVYEQLKPRLFDDEGQRKLLSVRDRVQSLLKQAGAVRMHEAMSAVSGDNWTAMACVDRLVELGEIREITNGNVHFQHRVFVAIERTA